MCILGDVYYHISQNTIASGLFDISSNGSVSISQTLDQYAEGSTLNFTIYAVDSGGRQDSALVQIVIQGTLNVAASSPTSDSTLKYFTFFSYAPNMAWFVPALMVWFAAICVVIYTMATADWTCLLKR